mgnify:CR=1 FL=1
MNVDTWTEQNKNKNYNYFGRHTSGDPIDYSFNYLGYRGKFYTDPDISIFGSSFSFGIGLNYNDCWHQNLGEYKVNCYAVAGWLINNNQILENYQKIKNQQNIGTAIIQLREFKYNTKELDLPNCNIFCIDQQKNNNVMTFRYSSFLDLALDNLHPGTRTHKQWAMILKNLWKL